MKDKATKFQEFGFTSEDIEENLFKPGYVSPENMMRFGYVDEIKSLAKFMEYEYNDHVLKSIYLGEDYLGQYYPGMEAIFKSNFWRERLTPGYLPDKYC